MKLSKILKRVQQIRDLAADMPTDHERCAQLEWELWSEYLHAEAMGKGSPAKAAAVSETTAIKFQRRWS